MCGKARVVEEPNGDTAAAASRHAITRVVCCDALIDPVNTDLSSCANTQVRRSDGTAEEHSAAEESRNHQPLPTRKIRRTGIYSKTSQAIKPNGTPSRNAFPA